MRTCLLYLDEMALWPMHECFLSPCKNDVKQRMRVSTEYMYVGYYSQMIFREQE
jgi:hypothetical protein